MKYSMTTLLAALAVTGTASAVPITWGVVQDVTGDAAADIIDGGNVLLAINGHNSDTALDPPDPSQPPDVTLDGVLFSSQNFLGQVFNADGLSPNPTGDDDYDLLLGTASIVDGGVPANNDAVYTIEGLTPGTDYLLQLWYVDERGGNLSGRVMTYGDGEGNTVDVAGEGANFFGQFVVGEFTPDASTQDLSLVAKDGAFGRSHITAILVREAEGGGFAPADLDQDGDVDDADFALFFAAFSGPGVPTGNPAADLDGDTDTDDADFGLAFAAFTGPGAAASVPEPTSLALLSLGGLLMTRRRRA